MYKVFIKITNGIVTAVNSDAFITPTKGWVQIDSGDGDRFHHAQNNYFPLPIVTKDGIYRYKFDGKSVIERTETEIAAEIALRPAPPPTAEQRIKALETELAALKSTTLTLATDLASIKIEPTRTA